MSELRLRDLDATMAALEAWLRAGALTGRARTNVEVMVKALAVAIPALQAMDGQCLYCLGRAACEVCDSTGKNLARRALDTVIGDAT